MGSALQIESDMENSTKRVLVIDDNEMELKLYFNGLGKHFDVSFAPNARTAWEMLNSAPLPDAIILDIMMPNEDGLNLCNRIKETQFIQDVPIIFVSSLTGPSVKSQAFELGGADFVTKPPMMTELIARLQRHIALYRKTKKLESLIFIDPLTHLPNEAKFKEVLGIEWARCARYWHHMTLLIIRVEKIQNIQEMHGNDHYFAVLSAVATTLSTAGNRPGDLVATLGNNEFAILLSDCGHDGAAMKAKQIEDMFKNEHISNTNLGCTISYAVAAPAGGGAPEELFSAVDNRLFESHQMGAGKIYPVNGVIGIEQ